MKAHSTKAIRLLRHGFGFALLLLAGGCGAVKSNVQVRYTSLATGPLSVIPPVTLNIRVEDHRPRPGENLVSEVKQAIGRGVEYYTTEPIPQIVAQALKSEFERNGHKTVPGREAAAVQLTVALNRFAALMSATGKSAEIDADIVVRKKGDASERPAFQVSGNYRYQHGPLLDIYGPNPTKPMNQALADFVHNLVFDERLLEALKD